jgi:hypothetical protein
MSGAAYLTGTPEQPMRAAVAWVDFGTASVSAFGTGGADRERRDQARTESRYKRARHKGRRLLPKGKKASAFAAEASLFLAEMRRRGLRTGLP